MALPILPAPMTYAAGTILKSWELAADITDAAVLLNQPPLFIGGQTLNAQAILTGTETHVLMDTEFVDNWNGHSLTANTSNYYPQFAGWYLCETSIPSAYTGSAGALRVDVIGVQAGGGAASFGGQRGPSASPHNTCTIAAKMMLATDLSTDYAGPAVNQTTGSTQNLNITINESPYFQAVWLCAASGTAGLPAPSNDTWPQPTTTLTASLSAGGTSITVASATGMLTGGTLGLDTANGWAETVTITSVAGTTIGISAATYAHANGSVVNVPISAVFMNKNVRDTIKFLIYPPVMEWSYGGGAVNLASAASVPTVGTTINLDTNVVDTYSAFNNGTNTFTAPVDGLYYGYGQVGISANSTGLTLGAGLTVTSSNYNSGTQITYWGGTQSVVTSGISVAVVRRLLRLNAGDTILLAGYQHDSAGTTAAISTSAAAGQPRLIMAWRSS